MTCQPFSLLCWVKKQQTGRLQKRLPTNSHTDDIKQKIQRTKLDSDSGCAVQVEAVLTSDLLARPDAIIALHVLGAGKHPPIHKQTHI
jgi:hypothetical protein